VSEHEFTRLVVRPVNGSLTFVCISTDQCTTSLDEEKNVIECEAMSDEILCQQHVVRAFAYLNCLKKT